MSGEVRGPPTLFIEGVLHTGPYDVDSLIDALTLRATCAARSTGRVPRR
jgi:hypothetical protein